MTRVDQLVVRTQQSLDSAKTPAAADPQRKAAWFREMERAQAESWFKHPPLVYPRLSIVEGGPGSTPQAEARPVERRPYDGSPQERTDAAASVDEPAVAVEARGERDVLDGAHRSATLPIEAAARAASPTSRGNPIPVAVALQEGAQRIARNTTSDGAGDGITALSVQGTSAHAVVASPPPLAVGLAGYVAPGALAPCPAPEPHDTRSGGVGGDMARQRAAEDAPVRVSARWEGDAVSLWLGVRGAYLEEMPAVVRRLREHMREKGSELVSVVCNGEVRDPATGESPGGDDSPGNDEKITD